MKKSLANSSQIYEKFLLIGNYNAIETETTLFQFLYDYNETSLVQEKTYYKVPIMIFLLLKV